MLREEQDMSRQRPLRRSFRKGFHGFSLIEVVITLVLTALLLSQAVPAFSAFMARNRLAAATNDVRGCLSFARQSAVTQGEPVAVCPGDSSAGCLSDWSIGKWLVFADSDHDGRLDGGESLLREGRVPGMVAGVSVSGNGPFRQAVVFVPQGHAERVSGAFASGRLRVCVQGGSGPNARELILSASGRVRLRSVDLDGACPPL